MLSVIDIALQQAKSIDMLMRMGQLKKKTKTIELPLTEYVKIVSTVLEEQGFKGEPKKNRRE